MARVLGLHMGRAEEAISVLERVSAGSRARARGPLELVRGEILLDQEQPVQAGAAFEIALKDQRSARAARKGLARCANVKGIALAEQGELEPALFQLKRAADLDPDWSGPCVNMGVVLGRLGKIAPVLEAYEAAMEREPGNPVIYYNLGTVLQQMGRLKEAAGALEDLLDLDPGFPNARLTLANLLGELKELGRARELLEEEVETDPSNPACWTSLGLTHICCGDDEQGERCLDRALELDPDYFNAIQNLLNLYIKQGRRQEAAVLMARARRLDPVRAEAMVAASPRFESQPEPLSEDPA